MLNILENEPLSKYTTFHIGGPAKHLVIVKNIEELREALEWAKNNQKKYFILGGGSNLFFSDAGYDGLIIKSAFADIIIEETEAIVSAGMPLLLAVKRLAEAGFKGLENFAGIPGTIGGAVCGNAGAYGSSMSEVVLKAEILITEDYHIEQVKKEWFEFGYRKSKLKYWKDKNKPIILRVWLSLEKGDKEELLARVKEVMEKRKEKEPKGFCAGCAFKNIKGDVVAGLLEKFDFTLEERERFGSRKAIPTAWFIDNAGLRGRKIGGAYIAEEHANYIMNDGSATADHVLQLISFVKQRVRDKFGVQLEEEIQIIL
ncbi:MAG: UDP-N-acetylenolpyruvoylglucosamine reductase [Parcubacteria group bacterium CG10_big_fil_rev_8_21_14_0_10_36_14]|nr:MAG: UDP-N-acetylenolpyruvoylglucosamine reductase [Parcubacteria group bacterium CG10_big_fil_rev_8_21_14_0_10_36_14]